MAGKFEPKTPVTLAPPKSDPISPDFLAKCKGEGDGLCYVAIKGKVFDVTGNKAYQPGGSYSGKDQPLSQYNPSRLVLFAGHDASRALAMTSTKAEDVRPDWSDLSDKEKGVLEDWLTFFSKRYNVVGIVEGATNQ
ncbi:Cytochrome b5-like Heme binding-containing protein [Venustampulla echinocandica]|uniref:Cytochrome b5-like Heme binding-containing protein n=1 Tax=Venustampulla echinocandica TaxID=2656787 RepID=A0A370TQ44_9HELO|nr:Cytochrome b5-like Heme binding-containing protein [Venustampulla echinocandica]RDL37638.1 Cytochrome b5-like Heme binding-containing protein [Venustampulla echinocandica]